MDRSYPRRRPRRSLFCLLAACLVALPAAAQENEDEEEDEDAVELRPVVVTGSRLQRPPTELSANLIVLDRDAIRATGELTLARVLRQLPQNVNGTNETYGSRLNGVANITGASTVNLRGIGSESTLILVDGRRVGYSGILGGVTDVSTIPLSMVERIEILLDGASAVYGSDAVGGVVNIITRQDYSGVEVEVNYGRPHKPGYDERGASVSTGFAWSGGRGILGYEYFVDSGLDGSERDSIIFNNRDDLNNQKGGLPGPQMRIFSWFFDDTCDAGRAVVYRLGGQVLTREEFAALSEADQGRAECHADITLPLGFMAGDDLNGIEIFGPPNWGEAAESGVSLRPEQTQHAVNVGIDHAFSDALKVHGTFRYTTRDTFSNSGLSSVNGTLHAGSPFNPFGRAVTVRGHVMNAEPRYFDANNETVFTRIGVEGSLGERWNWQAELGRSTTETKAQRLNVFDSTTVNLGLNTDGVSESIIASLRGIDQAQCEAERVARGGTRIVYSTFFGGICTIYGAPPDPINPFGDLSQYVAEGLNTASTNEYTSFEGLVRGELFDLPAGSVAVVAGFDYRADVLDTMSEFHATGGTCSALSCPSGSPAGAEAFSTRIERDNSAVYFEALVPLLRDRPLADRLNFTLSMRRDSYSNVDVAFRDSESGEAGTGDVMDPGSKTTWSAGFVYRLNDTVQFKVNRQTAFVAPQLNQLVVPTRSRVPADTFRGLFFTQPDSQGRTQCQPPACNIFNNTGGNDELRPETSESLSFAVELAPQFLPGLLLKASWSGTESEDRINYFSSFFVDPARLPSNVVYNAAADEYIRDQRWINVAYLERSGMDYEVRYQWETGASDFTLTFRHARTDKFDVQPDAANDEVQSLVAFKDLLNNDLDPILPAVPKHQSNLQLAWDMGGLSVAWDVQDSASTSTLRSGGTDGLLYTTVPARVHDLVLNYDFEQDTLFDAPSLFDGLRVSLVINNVTNDFASNTFLNRATGEMREYSINPAYEWTQGRAYRLTLQRSF